MNKEYIGKINDPLLPTVGDSNTRNHPILNSILLGCAIYLILYFNTVPPYVISNVGTFFIFIVYIFACLVSPLIITRLREKISILISILIFFILFLINNYVSSISLISNILSPIALELLWIAAGSFIFCISEKSNIGTSFGILFAVSQLLQGFDNFFLGGVGYAVYVLMFVLFLIFSIVLVLFLCNPTKETIEITNDKELLEELISPYHQIINSPEFLYIAISIVFIGFSSAIYPLGLMYLNEAKFVYGFENFQGTICIFGVLASLLTGFLFDRYKILHLIIGLLIFGLISTAISFIYIYIENSTFNYKSNLYYVSMIGYTVVKYGLLVFIYSIIGHLFHKKSLSANASIRIFQLLGTILSFIISSWISVLLTFYIFTALLITGCLSLAYFIKHKHCHDN